MVSSVYWEWELFLLSMRIGIKLAFIYEVIKICRVIFPHWNWVKTAQDMFFWSYATAVLFQLQLRFSEGVLRGFSILGVILGMLLFHQIFGKQIDILAEKGKGFFKRQLTEKRKLFKMKLCKRSVLFEKNGRENGTKKNSREKKETK